MVRRTLLALVMAAPAVLAPATASAGRQRGLAAGDGFICYVVNGGGRLYCWGRNDAGQFGDGTTNERHAPTRLTTAGGVISPHSIAAGDQNTCVLTSGSSAYCAGANGFGQIGDGTTVERHTHVQVAFGVNWITAGNTPCVAHLDGDVECWGWNQFGGVGDGTTTDRSLAVTVGTGADYVSSSGGNGHSCATISGALWCWGDNVDGALGAGPDVGPQSSLPIQVTALGSDVFNRSTGASAWANLAVGVHHSCVIKTDGTVWCWGLNDHGQLGDGTTNSSSTPVQVLGLPGLAFTVAVSANGSFSCASTNMGPYCWGLNDHGQLGDGTTVEQHIPVHMAFSQRADEIVVGADHGCLLFDDFANNVEQLWCWGNNDHGQVGDGTTVEQHAPVRILFEAHTVPADSPVAVASLTVALAAAATLMLLRRRARPPR
jgi:alpha-tubulin suppressor-like RCC1 family protein